MIGKISIGISIFFLALLSVGAPVIFAEPAEVIIIRHGEKLDAGDGLDPQGLARAQALVDFFENNPAVTQFGPPAAIYAMAPSSEDGSLRPIETVTPLAESLKLTINKDYARKDLPQLIQDVRNNPACDGKTALICWEHKAIPEIVKEFGWDQAPDSWSGKVFDRAWILNFDGDKVTSFKDIPEHVLPGDSSQ